VHALCARSRDCAECSHGDATPVRLYHAGLLGARRSPLPAQQDSSMSTIEVKVPDIGDFKGVPVIEILVKPGETIAKDQSLVTLESDKATMEVPSSVAGVVKEVRVKIGDEVAEGSVVAIVETEGAAAAPASAASAPAAKPAAATAPATTAPAAPATSAAAAPKAAGDSGRKADFDCDVVVLGSGPGGYTAAFRAADLGQNVVLVERYGALGGVCLNVGCIPSKALLHAARVIDEAAHTADIGITFGAPKIELDKLRAYKDKVVAQMNGGLAGMSKQRKVTVVTGTGAFVSPHEIEVDTKDGKNSCASGTRSSPPVRKP
jgi:dihydrolipoamide dehydrogenase